MNIDKLIGNTPLIKIKTKYKDKIVNVFVKLEYYNYTGSIKDRMANYIIKEAYKDGSLKKGMPIVEVTSGNTGIAFAALGAYYKHPVYIFIPDNASIERIKLMKLYGANVFLVSKDKGGFQEAIRLADKLSKDINGFRPNQFNNYRNVMSHYYSTGREIVNSIKKIDGFVSGIGTGGTLMGIGKRIKEKNPKAVIVALEPKQLPIISNGTANGKHRIDGIGDDFIPKIVDMNLIDKILTIDDEDAINMSKILAKRFGLGVGISSGANLIAAVLSGDSNANIVTIFADDVKKYLSTELVQDINPNSELISNNIEIIKIENLTD